MCVYLAKKAGSPVTLCMVCKERFSCEISIVLVVHCQFCIDVT